MAQLTREQFDSYIAKLSIEGNININFLFDVYETAYCGLLDMQENGPLDLNYVINSYELINYCLGEYFYSVSPLNIEGRNSFESSEDAVASVASIAADKYITLSMFNHKELKLTNKYFPNISSLNTYLNFLLNILNSSIPQDAEHKLIHDLLERSVSIARCILSLLVDGYLTEAFATWRTLHECECVLVILEKYNKPIINEYLKFMNYGVAYRDGYSDRNKYVDVFNEIKSDMAKHDLKSKDIKKYIEYGWLYAIEDINNIAPEFKLNFKDGLEVVSGLTECGSRFSTASEIVHSTPLLIYPNKSYFYFTTLLSLYESFFRLEKVFVSLYEPIVSDLLKARYLDMRRIYYQQLVNIYNRESQNFMNLKKKRA